MAEPHTEPPADSAANAHDLSPKAVKRRLGLNLVANTYNQGVTVAVQLLAIPLFLTGWGPEQYGIWLAITALPLYFYAISDLGFINLAANDMAMKRARNEIAEVIVVFQSTAVVVLVASALFVALALTVVSVVPFLHLLKIPTEHADAAVASLMILLAQLPLVLVLGLVNAGFRADGKYAFGALYQGTARLLDGLVPAVVAYLHGSLFSAAASMLIVKSLSVVIMFLLLRYQVRWLKVGVARANYQTISSMLGPAIVFLAMPLSHILQNSGTTLIVAAVMGPVAVATFNIIRTLGNLAFNAFGIVMNSVWFEMSSLLGGGQLELARAVSRRVSSLSFWLALTAAAFLALAGVPILRMWTRGTVEMNYALFYLQLTSIVIASLWRVSGVVLLATNNHRLYTIPLLAAAIVQLIVTWSTLDRFGLGGAGVAMLITEIVMLAAVLPPSLRLLGEHGRVFAAAVLTPPNPKALWRAISRSGLPTDVAKQSMSV